MHMITAVGYQITAYDRYQETRAQVDTCIDAYCKKSFVLTLKVQNRLDSKCTAHISTQFSGIKLTLLEMLDINPMCTNSNFKLNHFVGGGPNH